MELMIPVCVQYLQSYWVFHASSISSMKRKKQGRYTCVCVNRHTSLQEYAEKRNINTSKREPTCLTVVDLQCYVSEECFLSFSQKEFFVCSIKTHCRRRHCQSCALKRKMKARSERIENEHHIQIMTVLITS